MTYTALREFADSWGLVVMALVFLCLIGWAFRRGSGAANSAAAHMIFDEDQHNG